MARSAVVFCALIGFGAAWAQQPGQQPGQQQQEMFGGGKYDPDTLEDDWFYDSYSTKKGFGSDYYYSQQNIIGSFDQKLATDDWFFDQYKVSEQGRLGEGRIRTPRPGENVEGMPQPGQQGQQRVQTEQVQGQVEAVKEVEVVGTDTSHLVVLLSDAGERYVVDLGPSAALEQLNIVEGKPLQVEGRIARIGDRAVLFANQLNWQGQEMNIRQDLQMEPQPIPREPAQPKEMSGEILKLKEVQTEGGKTHTVALVAFEEGQMPVDLGPSDYFASLDINEGDTLRVNGRTMPIGEHLVLWADQIDVKGEKIDLRAGQQQEPRGRRGRGTK